MLMAPWRCISTNATKRLTLGRLSYCSFTHLNIFLSQFNIWGLDAGDGSVFLRKDGRFFLLFERFGVNY